jgi:hypothetical protein
MTVLVANIDVTVDSFGQWITKTNVLAAAMSAKVVTVDSNTAVGNAAITGSFTAGNVYANYLLGGNSGVSANLTVSSNAVFAANAIMAGYRTDLGLPANVAIQGGNSTFRILTVNSAAGNTLFIGKINFSDHADANVVSPGNGQVLVYSSSGTGYWYNTNSVNINTSTGIISASGFQYSNGQTFSALKVYYANNTQAFP